MEQTMNTTQQNMSINGNKETRITDQRTQRTAELRTTDTHTGKDGGEKAMKLHQRL